MKARIKYFQTERESMIQYFKKSVKFIAVLFFVLDTGYSVSWRADDFFGDWMQWQHSYSPQLLSSMKDHLNSNFLNGFKVKYGKHQDELKQMVPFLSWFGHGLFVCNGQLGSDLNLLECHDKFGQVYEWLGTNPGSLLSFLKNDSNFTNEEINLLEQNSDINAVINKYKSFAKLLFACPDKHLRGAYLFSLADQLFKWCFSPEHWSEFKSYLEDPKSHPVARFAYSIMWNYLVGRGWKDWNAKAIEDIKQKTQHGATLVYVAGGTDILQLLKNKIYNIYIIDPFLPTQGRYYSDSSWERWIKGSGKDFGKGDSVVFDFNDHKISMVRSDFKKNGEFQAKVSTGEPVKLDSSVTEWTVIGARGKILGKVVFDRRFATQSDFCTSKNRVVFMSFNEMYHAFQPTKNGGWGMDLSKISDNSNIYIKQLTFPVNKAYLNAINESEAIKFNFIRLGSCAT
ncbi:MAG: hypothetical protein US49_C0002G0104 [candidate division TM6 bacterium GW2011_GWF2_37_49]|nr:MAG: hypothetical protein US49_C0002G0104 [candidate division TM6 bacterium GW2011_GWF2_37_49]